MKVQNDILASIDQHGVVILVMLDLSAAFDTIDHDILFSRMENPLGITGQALAWFKSYLSGRTLRIKIDKVDFIYQIILYKPLQFNECAFDHFPFAWHMRTTGISFRGRKPGLHL